jgi:hypothetical protein
LAWCAVISSPSIWLLFGLGALLSTGSANHP